MSEVFEHNPGDHEDPLPGPTWIIAFLGAVLLVVIMLGLTALFYNAQAAEQDTKLVLRDPEELNKLRAEQMARLNIEKPQRVQELEKPVGQEKEQVVEAVEIPIKQAMEMVVKEYGSAK